MRVLVRMPSVFRLPYPTAMVSPALLPRFQLPLQLPLSPAASSKTNPFPSQNMRGYCSG